jgi:hemoglobin
MSADHPRHVADFVNEVFGGPKKYMEADAGSHAIMIARHIGKMLDEPKRKRWMQLLLNTADELGSPVDPEFRSALVGCLEWGSRIAVLYAQFTVNPSPTPSLCLNGAEIIRPLNVRYCTPLNKW